MVANNTNAEGAQNGANEGFDLDKALREKPDFLRFLAERYEDTPDMSPNAKTEREKDFKDFETLGVVKEKIKKIYKENIERDFGITLNVNDLKSVETHLFTKLAKEPNYAETLKKNLERFEALPGEITALQTEIGTLGNPTTQEAVVAEKEELLKKIKVSEKYLGTFGGLKLKGGLAMGFVKNLLLSRNERHLKKMNSATKKGYENLNEAREEILESGILEGDKDVATIKSELTASIAKLKEDIVKAKAGEKRLPELQNEFKDVQSVLIGGAKEVNALTELVRTKINQRMVTLMRATTTSGQNETAVFFEKLRRGVDESLTGIEDSATAISPDTDMLTKLSDNTERETLQKEIQDSITAGMQSKLDDFMNNTNADGTLITKLEAQIKPVLEQTRIGFVVQSEEIKRLLGESLNKSLEVLEPIDTTEKRMKALAVAHIKSKYSLN